MVFIFNFDISSQERVERGVVFAVGKLIWAMKNIPPCNYGVVLDLRGQASTLLNRAGLKGIKIKIDRGIEKMASNFPYFAAAQEETITLFPKAFTYYETLVKTPGHERTHIMQYSI